jgi:hypothetical protein
MRNGYFGLDAQEADVRWADAGSNFDPLSAKLAWLSVHRRELVFRAGPPLRKLSLAVAYFVAILYILSILLPSVYCLRHGCKGPGELDAFMPAFALIPFGTITTAFSLHNAIQHIRKGQSVWLVWPLAIIFSLVLLGTISFIAWMIYHTAVGRMR